MNLKRSARISLAVLVAGECLFFAEAGTFQGSVLDSESGAALAARVYLRDEGGSWHFVQSASAEGRAERYEKIARVNPRSIEMHTSVSAHPFTADLPPGRYTLEVERGKEWFPATTNFTVGAEPVVIRVPLRRWANMAERGWFSGDTHVHRTMAELPTVMLAEDLNVAFPLSYWVTSAFTTSKTTSRRASCGKPSLRRSCPSC